MHANSYNMMSEFRKFIAPGSRVLDAGGADVNGSYRPLFLDCSYTTLDYANADIVISGYDWPIEDESYDAVVCGQMLEHDKFFWLTMKNIARVLVPGGIACVIVPSKFNCIHRFPVDVYRFMPDSMLALGEWAGLELLHQKWDEGTIWGDLGGVFKKVIATSAP
jgi:SAM-dependent methyltransferase